MPYRVIALILLSLLTGCAGRPDWLPLPGAGADVAPGLGMLAPAVRTQTERRVVLSAADVWQGGPQPWWIATVPGRNELRVFNAQDGALLRTVTSVEAFADGQQGFDHPHRVSVIDDLALVSERDSGRIHLLELPSLKVRLSFGDGDDLPLDQPRSLWAVRMADWGYHVYVTDDYLGATGAPTDDTLGRRVKHYALTRGALGWSVRGIRVFGETRGDGRLQRVDALAGDAANRRLLIADTDRAAGRRAWLYSTQGRVAERSVGGGVFRSGIAGLALLECGEGGLWLATDAGTHGHYLHAFDRVTLDHRGSFGMPALSESGSLTVSPGVAGRILVTLADGNLAGFDGQPLRALTPACSL